MSWNNGNGQQQQRKLPEPGRGRLRPPRGEVRLKPDGSRLSPNFTGLVNHEGQILSLSIWYEAAKAGTNGQMMPENFSVRVSRHDPNAQWQHQGQPAPQQQMQYPPQQPAQQYGQPVYAQPAPGPAYAPSPQPPQHGGYTPAPGYQPPPPAAAPPAPQWGGQPAQGRPPQAGYKAGEVPF